MKAIELSHVEKSFGETKALKQVSLSVEEGEVFGFLGPNGAGKTTAIRCMMDFLRPDTGTISILEKDSSKDAVELKRVLGYLSGNIRLYDNWTGKDHIAFIARFRGGKNRASDLVSRLKFNDKVRAKNLSSGNRQKLGIILAFMSNPRVLILDEPTNALDPLLQNTIYELILEAAKNGTTVFMSSHNLVEVERICNRVSIIRNGEIVATDRISALKEKKIYTVRITTEQPLNTALFVSHHTEIREQTPHMVTFKVTGDINEFLQRLPNQKISDISITRANLEDIFMEYYKD